MWTLLDDLRARPARPLSGLLAALALAGACGDDTTTSAGATEGESASETAATTTDATTSPTTDASASASAGTATGTASDSESGTTTATTGETTAVSSGGATEDATTTGDPTTAGTTAGTTTGDTDTGTTTGGDPIVCSDATLPYAGPLCGPPELPCVVVANEAASADHVFRNEAPAIALDAACGPQILYSVAENGYFGFFSRREGPDQWASEPTPFEIARVGLAYDYAGDRTLALAYDGAFGTSLWSHQGDTWTPHQAVAGQHIASAHAFARGGDGRLHASLYTGDNKVRHAVHDGAWALTDVAGQATASTALALDPDGAPHLTFWRTEGPSWQLTYAAPPAPPEPAFDLAANVLDLSLHGVAVIPGDDDPLPVIPYVLHARRAGGELHAIVLSRRVGQGKWISEDVIVEDDQGASLCQGEPQGPDDTCAYDYVRYRPETIVASAGGDVRFLYLMIHHQGTLAAECVQQPFPMCFWAPQIDESEAELRIGWPTEQGPAWATLAEGIFATDLTVVVDAAGRLHAAIYDSEGTGSLMVRYLAFE